MSSTEIISSYITALVNDIVANLPNVPIDTIYFGGGTPSLLSINQLEQIIGAVGGKPKEITIEANPDSITDLPPKELLAIGINRLSLGIQSWHPDILEHMNRDFDKTTLQKYITTCQSTDLTNINLDHIIAYPQQTDDILNSDIQQSLSLSPTHISIYPLEIHPHTQLEQLNQDEALVVRQFSIAQILLQQQGYHHYEELNFSKQGYECLHNVNFWQGKDYLGFGPSAVSRIGNTISENAPNVIDYISHPTTTKTMLSTKDLKRMKKDLRLRLL